MTAFRVVLLLLFSLCGCTPSFKLGAPVGTVATGLDWVTGLQGNDAYIRVQAETNARTAGADAPVADLCSQNVFARWIKRDGEAAVLIGVNGEGGVSGGGNTPILTNTLNDATQSCTTLYQTRPVGPAVLIPAQSLGSTPISVEFRAVNKNSTNVSVSQIVSDGLTVAGAVTAAGAVPALATAGAISKAVTPLAQQMIDSKVKGTQTVTQPISIGLDTIHMKKLVYSVPVLLPGEQQPFADVVVRIDVIPSIFRPLSTVQDPTGKTAPLDLSARTPASLLDRTILFDPNVGMVGQAVTLRSWLTLRYPGGNTALAAAVSSLNAPGLSNSAGTQLAALCRQLSDMKARGDLPLSDKDRAILLWALLSGTQAWSNASLLGADCFDKTDLDALRAVKLSLPGEPPASS
jgi:hypothetical protein